MKSEEPLNGKRFLAKLNVGASEMGRKKCLIKHEVLDAKLAHEDVAFSYLGGFIERD